MSPGKTERNQTAPFCSPQRKVQDLTADNQTLSYHVKDRVQTLQTEVREHTFGKVFFAFSAPFRLQDAHVETFGTTEGGELVDRLKES